jgi:folylpolyglutamate synthase/dihydropteroate synthase
MEDLLAAAAATGTQAVVASSVPESIQIAENKIDVGQIVVSGSVYLVGEARSILLAGGAEGGVEP